LLTETGENEAPPLGAIGGAAAVEGHMNKKKVLVKKRVPVKPRDIPPSYASPDSQLLTETSENEVGAEVKNSAWPIEEPNPDLGAETAIGSKGTRKKTFMMRRVKKPVLSGAAPGVPNEEGGTGRRTMHRSGTVGKAALERVKKEDLYRSRAKLTWADDDWDA
jgi:hypothetical protein